jgi:type III secretion protein V
MTPLPLAANAPPSGSALSDLGLATLVVAVIVMMALPLPAWSLDMLVAVNIALAVLLLLVALFIPTPLAFSTFPAVLLVTTLFRISLNVATTRQILLHAHAGDIIAAFGRLVVGGSLVVGLVVFLIITVVQFIVVAKGAERVAEVSARFTLDAMPGKQMSIDADLRAGMLSQAEAVQRRRELVQESQFYGAMDGAMKFVKGDAIAGIVIVLVNLLGGIAIGTLSMGLGFGAAVQKFSVLSIGDGLVTQIPALFVSIAAGIAITRTAPDGSANLGQQIGRQLGGQPRALLMSAGVMVLFAGVPGFPTFTFLGLAALLGVLGVTLTRTPRAQGQQRAEQEVPSAAREGDKNPVLLQVGRTLESPPSCFRLEFGSALAARLGAQGLDQALQAERRALREHFGIPFPGVELQIVPALPPDACSVVVQDLPEARFELPEGTCLALGPGAQAAQAEAAQAEAAQAEAAQAEAAKAGAAPAGAAKADAAQAPTWPDLFPPGRWVRADEAEALRQQNVQVLGPAETAARALILAIQRNAEAALGTQGVRQLLREAEGRFPDLVREAQSLLPLPRLADLLAALSRERVPLTDLPGLLQAVVTNSHGMPDLNLLYEKVRKALARSIVARQLQGADQELPVIVLDTEFESRLRAALSVQGDGPVLALDPASAQQALKALQAALARVDPSRPATLLLPADLRRACSRLFRAGLPHAAFISIDEIQASGRKTQTLATASLAA